jgi:hypothetical protein
MLNPGRAPNGGPIVLPDPADAIVIPSSGPPGFISARRVRVPEFEIESNPTVRLSDVRKRRFIQPRACPVCKKGLYLSYEDMWDHISSTEDGEHAAHSVMET